MSPISPRFVLSYEPNRGRLRLPLFRIAIAGAGYLTDGASSVEELATQIDLLKAELESLKEQARLRMPEPQAKTPREQTGLF